MQHYSTCIYLVVYIKKAKIFSFFTEKTDILTFILGNACIAITCISGHCHIKKVVSREPFSLFHHSVLI